MPRRIMRDPDQPRQGIYFVAGAGLIKIGYSYCVPNRFTSLRYASPIPLTAVGFLFVDDSIDGLAYEASLHRQFAARREHGEWFRDCPEIRAYIATYAQPWPWRWQFPSGTM